MVNSHFFNIIIPCFNSEKWLPKCLDSILSQSFKDFSVFIINNCSTDDTQSIINSYIRKYPNKIFSYKTNKQSFGLSRKIGFHESQKIINSKYTWFVDSDDYLYDDYVLQKIFDYISLTNNKSIYKINAVFSTGGHVNGRTAPFFNIIKTIDVKADYYEGDFPCEDVYPYFVQYDSIDDNDIIKTDIVAYVYTGSHNNMTCPLCLFKRLIQNIDKFSKPRIRDSISQYINWQFNNYSNLLILEPNAKIIK